jgi:hypothetical protein
MTTFVRCDVCGFEVGADEPHKSMQINSRRVANAVASEDPFAFFHLHDACWDGLVAWAGTQRGTPPAGPEPPPPPEGAAAVEEPNG